MNKRPMRVVVPLLQTALLLGCGADRVERVVAPSEALTTSSLRDEDNDSDGRDGERARFSDWSAPVNVGPPVNTVFVEQGPAISKDGLSLYFQCMNCPGGVGGVDIWVSRRASTDAPWGTSENLGPAINTSSNEGGASLSDDGHLLFFTSNRPGGFGGNDLYAATRHDKRDDLTWQPAQNLGDGVNTSANETTPQPYEDATGRPAIYFSSDRSGGLGSNDIYSSTLRDHTFTPPVLVEELSSPFNDQGPAVRRDGLELIFVSDRPGTLGQLDLWVSTRSKTRDPWSTPVNLGPTINSAFIDGGPEFSFDGTALYFHSVLRPGGAGPFFDLWVATREKLRGRD